MSGYHKIALLIKYNNYKTNAADSAKTFSITIVSIDMKNATFSMTSC
jgi:hypothetical protein